MNQEQIESLLKARADVQMPANYTHDLLRQLRERQRAELLHRPLWRIARDRVEAFLSEQSISTPAYALALAALVALSLGAMALLRPTGNEPTMARQQISVPKSSEPLTAPIEAQHVSYGKER